MAKVSVILPVYGVEEFIDGCVKSLLAQTLDDIEFIFVDDHGPDSSIELAKKSISGHVRESQFVFVCPDKNLGAGMARNYGMDFANGEYIAFVDPDDTIEPDMMRVLYEKAKEVNSDMTCCQMQKCYMGGIKGDLLVNPIVKDGVITHEDRAYILTHYVSLFASMIYRRDFLLANNIRFPEERAADDSYFVSCAWMMAERVAYVNQPLYNYLIRPGSVTTTKQSDKYKKRLAVFGKLLQYSKDQGVYDEYKDEIGYMYLKKGFLSSVANYIRNSESPKKSTYLEIHQELERLIPDYRCNAYYRNDYGMRLLVWLLLRCPMVATIALRYYIKKKNIIS